jgi:hypothetical protein
VVVRLRPDHEALGLNTWVRLCKGEDGASLAARTMGSELLEHLFGAAQRNEDLGHVIESTYVHEMERKTLACRHSGM